MFLQKPIDQRGVPKLKPIELDPEAEVGQPGDPAIINCGVCYRLQKHKPRHWGIAANLPASADAEANAARQAAAAMGIAHEVLRINSSELGAGLLANEEPLPGAPTREWWPYRNQLLITVALMRAIKDACREILIGSVASDGQHADGRAEFVQLIDELAAMQEGKLRVRAPALHMTSADLVRISAVPRAILSWSHSCHRANYPCADCRGCYKRQAVLEDLGWDG